MNMWLIIMQNVKMWKYTKMFEIKALIMWIDMYDVCENEIMWKCERYDYMWWIRMSYVKVKNSIINLKTKNIPLILTKL